MGTFGLRKTQIKGFSFLICVLGYNIYNKRENVAKRRGGYEKLFGRCKQTVSYTGCKW